MTGFRLDQLLDLITGLGFFLGALWLALIALTVTLIVLTYTRWGQSRSVRKCLAISLLAHVWLACFSTTVHPLGPVRPALVPEDETVQVASIEGLSGPKGMSVEAGGPDRAFDPPAAAGQPWERLADAGQPATERVEPAREKASPTPSAQRKSQSVAELPGQPSADRLPLAAAPAAELAAPEAAAVEKTAASAPAQRIDVPAAERRQSQPPVVPIGPRPPRPANRETPQLAMKTTRDLPTALLEQSHEPPRMSVPPVAVDAVGPIAAESVPVAPPARERPATIEPQGTKETSGPAETPDPAYSGQREESSPARMWTPSLAAVAARQNLAATNEPVAVAALVTPGVAPRHDSAKRDVPQAYRLRVAPDRAQLAQRHGATGQTEAAVKAALRWLGSAQSADGHWDARKYGSGRETKTDGHFRDGAGTAADTGITGLALLAFLASGHTHREGPYAENVYRGLRYLLESQAPDGNLGGRATTFEFMYCHGISTFALSEALGMSGDEALREPLRRALAYTIAAQDPTTGGWRYRPGDPGDTSQLGWQFMALKSAELAGLPTPETTRNGIMKFLGSVAGGQQGGLASYRPKEQYTRTMTAEAIACWQFLGMRRDHPAGREAGDFLLEQLPGQGTDNVYYWYYATLTMYQLGGIHWTRWNEALRSKLVDAQRTDGQLAGSWDPDSMWGGYGGRIFSTSLSTLCLEIYYRFLPLYREAALDEEQAR
jgi:hypothetical protein